MVERTLRCGTREGLQRYAERTRHSLERYIRRTLQSHLRNQKRSTRERCGRIHQGIDELNRSTGLDYASRD